MGADRILDRLDGVQGRGPRWRAICPAHQSKNKTRTLAVTEADDGRILLHCFAGCDVHSVVSAVGMELDDLFPDKPLGERPKVRKPISDRDAVQALGRELYIAWVILRDVAAGRPVSTKDRKRGGEAADRCEALIHRICE